MSVWIQTVLATSERTFQSNHSLQSEEGDSKRLVCVHMHFVIEIAKAAQDVYIVRKDCWLQLCLSVLQRGVAHEPAVNSAENDPVQGGH